MRCWRSGGRCWWCPWWWSLLTYWPPTRTARLWSWRLIGHITGVSRVTYKAAMNRKYRNAYRLSACAMKISTLLHVNVGVMRCWLNVDVGVIMICLFKRHCSNYNVYGNGEIECWPNRINPQLKTKHGRMIKRVQFYMHIYRYWCWASLK